MNLSANEFLFKNASSRAESFFCFLTNNKFCEVSEKYHFKEYFSIEQHYFQNQIAAVVLCILSVKLFCTSLCKLFLHNGTCPRRTLITDFLTTL